MPGSQPVAGLRHLLWRMSQRWAGSGGAGRSARSGARRPRPPGQRLSCPSGPVSHARRCPHSSPLQASRLRGGVVFYSCRPSGRVPSGLCRWCRPAAAFARVVAGRAAARRMAARRRAGCGAVKALREWRGWPTPALRPVRPRRRPLPRGFAAQGRCHGPVFWQYVTNSFAAVANRTED